MQNFDHNIGFCEKTPIFSQKIVIISWTPGQPDLKSKYQERAPPATNWMYLYLKFCSKGFHKYLGMFLSPPHSSNFPGELVLFNFGVATPHFITFHGFILHSSIHILDFYGWSKASCALTGPGDELAQYLPTSSSELSL
jgi:hypothetical protein